MSTFPDKYDQRGRKFTALLIAAFLLVYLITLMVVLALTGNEVPGALGIVAISLASCFPGYLGVNVIQKKIQEHKAQIAEEKNV